jgi:hypothetical protein
MAKCWTPFNIGFSILNLSPFLTYNARELIMYIYVRLIFPFALHMCNHIYIYIICISAHSWTSSASIIFVEQPMFVGYSISSEAEDFVTDDDVNGERLVKFLVNWFEKFDAYKGREFYLMSESYGGHYL